MRSQKGVTMTPFDHFLIAFGAHPLASGFVTLVVAVVLSALAEA